MQEEGTSAGLDGAPPPGMSRAARTADEAEAASKAAEDMTPVTYNYSFFHFVFALASMYLAMLMTGVSLQLTYVMPSPQRACGRCRSGGLSGLLSLENIQIPHVKLHSELCADPCMCGRVGHRGGGEGSDRRGMVLSMGEVCDSVGDCSNLLLDADSTHSVP